MDMDLQTCVTVLQTWMCNSSVEISPVSDLVGSYGLPRWVLLYDRAGKAIEASEWVTWKLKALLLVACKTAMCIVTVCMRMWSSGLYSLRFSHNRFQKHDLDIGIWGHVALYPPVSESSINISGENLDQLVNSMFYMLPNMKSTPIWLCHQSAKFIYWR